MSKSKLRFVSINIMYHFPIRPFLSLVALLAGALPAAGHDRILTIGSGTSASNTQASLEKNVLFLQSYLHTAGLGSIPHDILFANGKTDARDIQFEDPTADLPRVNDLLAQLSNNDHLLTAQYRPHAIPNVTDAANRSSLNTWFDRVGKSLTAEDRLIIYYTGHGGRASDKHGTTIALWAEDDLNVQDFRKLLDKLPPSVPVVLVMAQCFSGGFADLIYNEANPNRGLSSRKLCGFFATLHDRVAAGCTADINEADYKEYSTYFFAALIGHTRAADTRVDADFDHDGRVSFAEAHAYALITSDTIDIPLRTSDLLLRKNAFGKNAPTTQSATRPTSRASTYAALRASASALDGLVLDALAKSLKLDGPDFLAAARTLADSLQKQKTVVDDKRNKLRDSHNNLRSTLNRRVRDRWPELTNLLHPRSMKILQTEADQIVKLIESSPQYPEFEKQAKQIDDLKEQSMNLERTWVKSQRFLRQAETVTLAADLAKRPHNETQDRYRQLLEMENTILEK